MEGSAPRSRSFHPGPALGSDTCRARRRPRRRPRKLVAPREQAPVSPFPQRHVSPPRRRPEGPVARRPRRSVPSAREPPTRDSSPQRNKALPAPMDARTCCPALEKRHVLRPAAGPPPRKTRRPPRTPERHVSLRSAPLRRPRPAERFRRAGETREPALPAFEKRHVSSPQQDARRAPSAPSRPRLPRVRRRGGRGRRERRAVRELERGLAPAPAYEHVLPVNELVVARPADQNQRVRIVAPRIEKENSPSTWSSRTAGSGCGRGRARSRARAGESSLCAAGAPRADRGSPRPPSPPQAPRARPGPGPRASRAPPPCTAGTRGLRFSTGGREAGGPRARRTSSATAEPSATASARSSRIRRTPSSREAARATRGPRSRDPRALPPSTASSR